MATLQSPGVQVSVVNESFYTSAAPGTVPMIFVASAQDKINPSGTLAAGTTSATAGKVYLITSQRDLTDTFGVPNFITDASGNPIHGSEQNEYGLQAAYSLLGVSSAAYVVRAPVDLAALSATSTVPAGTPADGTVWLDTRTSTWGIFEWNGSKFVNKTPIVIDNSNYSTFTVNGNGETPSPSIGRVGDYAIVVTGRTKVGGVYTEINTNKVWYKNADGNWVVVGSDERNIDSWTNSIPVVTASAKPAGITVAGTITINDEPIVLNYSTGTVGTVNLVVSAINAVTSATGVVAKNVGGALTLYANSNAPSDGSTADGNIVISSNANQLMSQLGLTAGSYQGPATFVGPHTQYPDFSNKPTGSVYVKTTSPNSGQVWQVKKWAATTQNWSTVNAPVYANGAAATYSMDRTGGGVNIPVGTVYVESNFDHGNNSYVNGDKKPMIAEFKIKERVASTPTTITSAPTAAAATITANSTLSVSVSLPGTDTYTNFVDITVGNGTGTVSALMLAVAINNSGVPHLSATPNADGSISISHDTGGEIRFKSINVLLDADFSATADNLYELGDNEIDGALYIASNWKPLSYEARPDAITSSSTDGQLWFDSRIDQVDIMYHDGAKWVGYRTAGAFPTSDPNGPIVSASKPTTQSDGTALVHGDIWISTASGSDNYGKEIYIWDTTGSVPQWRLQDVTDQTSPDGWLFADARWATTGQATEASSIADLALSNYVDPDAPDPAEYPRGMRLFNLRRSGNNVKQFVSNYIDTTANGGMNIRVPNDSMATYNVDRWVSVSPNNEDGSGSFGRHAQRSYVVTALKSLIDSNTMIRDTDGINFNLIACPGYPETIQNMINFNVDRGLTAFVLGDTPFRLPSDATSLSAWGNNVNGALDNNEVGAVSQNEYMAMYYPSGYTNDLRGNNIVVPSSHMMLRTIALSDQQSYPWFAPAGIRRGVVDNVTSVGYIDKQSGEFKQTTLPENIRNVMATNGKVNPIATLNGVGVVAYGQYTRSSSQFSSALDRINVARLICYLRRQLDILAKPFLFEPNDKITRDEFKNAADSLLLELVGQRALYDFITVCDESNNTPARIDRSELWLDVAIEPVKAVEFIYIPIRLVNTGDVQAGNFTVS